jgi:hypothetical protein
MGASESILAKSNYIVREAVTPRSGSAKSSEPTTRFGETSGQVSDSKEKKPLFTLYSGLHKLTNTPVSIFWSDLRAPSSKINDLATSFTNESKPDKSVLENALQVCTVVFVCVLKNRDFYAAC